MARRKYIALDLPTEGLSISDDQLLQLMQDCFLQAATSDIDRGRQQAALRLSQAVPHTQVENYDDRVGHPVFYIP